MKKSLSWLLALCLSLPLALTPASALTLEQARALLAEHYVDPIPPEILSLDSLDSILAALDDPYTFYMTPEQYEAFNQSVNGQVVVGIGATVENAFDGGYRIMSVLPESPALEAGLQPGDILTEVDGRALTAEIDPRLWIAGEEGTPVLITVLRSGQRLSFALIRRAVTIPIVSYEQAGSAAIIRCISFGESTADGFEEALLELEDQTSVWIVDLRSNPGGDSAATAATAGLFAGSGVMLYFRNGAGDYHYTFTMPGYPDLTDKPVIVLTSENSASGSELFAGDMRAFGTGIALGQRTFGKGTAQLVLEQANCPYMEPGEAMKITAYRFFAPDGATNYITGVLPTLLVSPENTETAALLLSCPPSSFPENHLKLDLAGQTFYVDLTEAMQEENRAALTELLEALPPSAQLRYSTGQNWDDCPPIAPAALAWHLVLPFTPRTLPDAADSPYAREIDTLCVYGVLSGGGDGLFHPDGVLTRAQLCAMTAAALNLTAGKNAPFSDVDGEAWYAGPVQAMASLGFVSGRGDGSFGPEDPVTGQELASILARVAAWASMDGYALNEQELSGEEQARFADYPDWARTAARNLDELGVLLEDLAPGQPAARDQAAAMLCRLMEQVHLIWN